NILQSMNEACPYCLGTGYLTKKSNLMHEIDHWLKRFKAEGKGTSLTLKVHPSLGEKLKEGFISPLSKIQLRYFVRLKLIEDEKMSPQHFYFISTKTGDDITADFV
ncbi:MAG: Rne/Rng family ribonuclease, partial [Melioribacteraceae bacterium]